jgi:hypothetical protein
MRRRDARLWNQVIRTNQFIFSVLTPLITSVSDMRIFLVLRYTHFSFLIISIHAKFGKTWSQQSARSIFLNRMHVAAFSS